MQRRCVFGLMFGLLLASSVEANPDYSNAGSGLPEDMPFSAAVRQGDVLYLSGQIGTVPGTKTLVAGGIRAEAEQTIRNIDALLKAHGRSLRDLIRCTVMLADIGEWATFNEVWMSMLAKPYPARSAFATNGLALGARVEVECSASMD
jgi:2-iminobutanoate/2-iminopropanoate deaminase